MVTPPQRTEPTPNTPPPARAQTNIRNRHRVAAVAIAVVLGVHLAAMFLWISPRTPVTDAVDAPLRAYTLPMFQQSWSLFAPDPVHAAYYLEVRRVPQDLSETPWLSASAVELAGLHHHLLPTTATNITNKTASLANEALNALPDDHKALFTWHFHHDVQTRLISEGLDGQNPTTQFNRAMTVDRAVTAYATQFLSAQGQLVEGDLVQYRILRVSSPDFADRATQGVSQTVSFTSGRRPPEVLPGQDVEAFERALEAFS